MTQFWSRAPVGTWEYAGSYPRRASPLHSIAVLLVGHVGTEGALQAANGTGIGSGSADMGVERAGHSRGKLCGLGRRTKRQSTCPCPTGRHPWTTPVIAS